MKIKITPYVALRLTKQILLFIRYLIKNKGDVTLLILKEDLDDIYNIKENEDNYTIHTNIINIIYDII